MPIFKRCSNCHDESCSYVGYAKRGACYFYKGKPKTPKSPTPFGLLERLVRWFLLGLKWCLRTPMTCIFWGFVACCLAIGKFAECIERLYDWTNKTT